MGGDGGGGDWGGGGCGGVRELQMSPYQVGFKLLCVPFYITFYFQVV